MIWQQCACSREIVDAPGPGGLLILGDAFGANLEGYFGTVQCVYLDPPSVSGKRFDHRMRLGEEGWSRDRPVLSLPAYEDFPAGELQEYLEFLRAGAVLAWELLHPSGTFFLHLDQGVSAHARLLCDGIFGTHRLVNEIIWSYQTGGRSKKYFSRKHDTILMYAKSEERFFDITQVPGKRKSELSNHLKRGVDEHGRAYRTITSRGKTYIYYDDEPTYPDDVWTDVSQMQQKDPQRTGYAGQKPQALLDRVILCCTKPGDLVADFMCGSGTSLAAAAAAGRRFLGIDRSPQAFSVSRKRLAETRMECRAPLCGVNALVDASLMTGIGYYTLTLHAYTLPADTPGAPLPPQLAQDGGLGAVDQWYAGLLNGDSFTVYASAARRKQTPALETALTIPLLRGTVALMVIDVLGNRTLWTAVSQV